MVNRHPMLGFHSAPIIYGRDFRQQILLCSCSHSFLLSFTSSLSPNAAAAMRVTPAPAPVLATANPSHKERRIPVSASDTRVFHLRLGIIHVIRVHPEEATIKFCLILAADGTVYALESINRTRKGSASPCAVSYVDAGNREDGPDLAGAGPCNRLHGKKSGDGNDERGACFMDVVWFRRSMYQAGV